jgi:hypothetical protein
MELVPYMGRVNRVFEHVGVPYEPCLKPDSEACEEATKKIKNDVRRCMARRQPCKNICVAEGRECGLVEDRSSEGHTC